MFQAVIYRSQGVFNGEDETGGELLKSSPGIHQCGRIGKKIEAGHTVVPALSRVGQPTGCRIESFGLCDVGRDAPEQLCRCLDDRSRSVLCQIAPTENDLGMG